MEIIQVFLVDMPAKIEGLTIKNSDDSYTVFINAGLSSIAQCRAYDHELEHINNHDWDNIYDAGEIERIRNKWSA